MQKQYYVYMMTNQRNGTLYIGVTSNLLRRVWEHKEKVVPGFTKKHDIHQLVYFEYTDSVEAAIHREKRLKKYTRAAKLNLIESTNPEWRDLYHELAA